MLERSLTQFSRVIDVLHLCFVIPLRPHFEGYLKAWCDRPLVFSQHPDRFAAAKTFDRQTLHLHHILRLQLSIVAPRRRLTKNSDALDPVIALQF